MAWAEEIPLQKSGKRRQKGANLQTRALGRAPLQRRKGSALISGFLWLIRPTMKSSRSLTPSSETANAMGQGFAGHLAAGK